MGAVLIPSAAKMARFARLVFIALTLLSPVVALAGAAEDAKEDGAIMKRMAHDVVRCDGAHAHADLFAQLAPQARFPRLAHFPLAAWKLPEAAEGVMVMPLADEVAAAPLNDGDGGVEMASVLCAGH